MQRIAYRDFLLLLLMIILAFNYVDRMALGLVLQDIKSDLELSDSELGFLSGIAFAFFYSIMGIPIARWADRGNRILIISVTTAMWSVAVALCGIAANFLQLVLVRVGVAVGEAGCIPPAHALIADHFDRAERPRAVGRYMLGIPLSLTVGYFVAGWLNELYGWRLTFVILGLPGLLLSVLAITTLRDPRHRIGLTATPKDGASAANPGVRTVTSVLWRSIAFRHLLLCFSVWYFFGYGLLQWTPAFFVRSHGLQTGELGSWFALVYGVAGSLGVYLGGEWASRYAAGKERLQLYACAAAFVVYAILYGLAFLVDATHWAFLLLAVAVFGGNLAQGPILATMQTLVPADMRAVSIAIVYMFANLIGMGFGPVAAGVLSDELRPWFGDESLRYALVILCPGYFWASWHLWRAGRAVEADLANAGRADRILPLPATPLTAD